MFEIPTLSLPIQWQLGTTKVANYLQKHMYMNTLWTSLIENEARFVYRFMRDYRFASLFENVALQSLKSFFQLKDQVDICLYLTEDTALRHAGLKPSQCTLSPISTHFIRLMNNFHQTNMRQYEQ